MRALPALLACALAAVPAAGCGDIDAGSRAVSGHILYQDPKGAFEFRLLEPPWIPPRPVYPELRADVLGGPAARRHHHRRSDGPAGRGALQPAVLAGDGRSGGGDGGGEGDDPGRRRPPPSAPVTTASGLDRGRDGVAGERGRVSSRRVPGGDGHARRSGCTSRRRKRSPTTTMVGQMISSFRAK